MVGSADSGALRNLLGLRALIVGGGITGLTTAHFLALRGAEVLVLERDPPPPAGAVDEVFANWERSGAPQIRHSHVFLGRLRNLLRDHDPALLEAVLDAGAREMRLTDRLPPALEGRLRPEPGDDDLVALACRRTTFEAALRRAVEAHAGVTVRSDVEVDGLLAGRVDPPVVRGVRSVTGEKFTADFVVDASGRRSKAAEWLQEIAARPPQERSEPSGIVYYTRFYRLRPGANEPQPAGHPTVADYHWIKFAVFLADHRTFSITLAVPVSIPRLKVVARASGFEAMVRSIPGLAPWTAPEVSEPLDPAGPTVRGMGGLVNRLRRFVDDRGPVALRFFVLGDAVYCTNPLYGRGCTQGALHGHLLAEALSCHGTDWAAAARALDRSARAQIEPFFWASILADRDAVRRAEGRAPARLRDRLRERFFDDGVAVGIRCDPVIYRAFLRMMNMMEPPDRAFGRPAVLLRTLRILARGKGYNSRYALPQPIDRDSALEHCEAAVLSG